MNKNIENLIIRFLNNRAGIEELEALSQWLKEPGNEDIFRSFVRVNFLIESSFLEFNTEETKKNMFKKIQQVKERSSRKRRLSIAKYAAIFIVLLGVSYFFQNDLIKPGTEDIVAPTNEYVTLERGDGSIEIIKPQESRDLRNSKGAVVGKQDKSRIIYSQDSEEETLVYNTLKIPYGKKFQLELSDGSLVHLNSGSSITYPVKFHVNEERSVQIEGEAFFDVTTDPQNPFIVHTGSLNIRVTGTRFNVAAYPEDPTTDVVLVEGRVALYSNSSEVDHATALLPGTKGSYHRQRQVVEVEEVNTTIYTAWREGELVFRNMSFNNILKKLERNFHVELVNKNSELGNQVFNASFNNEELKTILEYFDESYNINYEIRNNRVIFE